MRCGPSPIRRLSRRFGIAARSTQRLPVLGNNHRREGGDCPRRMMLQMGQDRAADFVKRFTEFWQAPALERLDTVLAPNASLSAPMIPTTHGLEGGKRAFEDLFELIPDMTAEVHRWGATSDGVLIELTVRGTAGGTPVSWQSVDRFVLDRNGLATERFTYFDSLPLLLTMLRRPRVWPAFIRSRTNRQRA